MINSRNKLRKRNKLSYWPDIRWLCFLLCREYYSLTVTCNMYFRWNFVIFYIWKLLRVPACARGWGGGMHGNGFFLLNKNKIFHTFPQLVNTVKVRTGDALWFVNNNFFLEKIWLFCVGSLTHWVPCARYSFLRTLVVMWIYFIEVIFLLVFKKDLSKVHHLVCQVTWARSLLVWSLYVES